MITNSSSTIIGGGGVVGINELVNDPDYKYSNRFSRANYSGPLRKVRLTSRNFPDGITRQFTFPYNPEEISTQYGTRFGEYTAVRSTPIIYFGGVEANKMEIKFIVNDRANGVSYWYEKLLQFSKPAIVGSPKQGNTFASPPMCNLDYGKFGTFIGYVERPSMTPRIMDKDLMPIIADLHFTFISLRRLSGSTQR